MERFGLYAPVFEIPPLHCARYAVLAAKALTNTRYQRANAWELAEKNERIELFNNPVKDISRILKPGKSIVVFYDPGSEYNQEFRIGTHAAVYLGNKKEPIFAEQYIKMQGIISLSEMLRRGNIPVQIVHPRIYKE